MRLPKARPERQISGTGPVTVSGGNQTLSGVNTYTGLTTVNAGATLTLTGAGSVAPSFAVKTDGVFDITTTTSGTSIQSLMGAGSVLLGSKPLTITSDGRVLAAATAELHAAALKLIG